MSNFNNAMAIFRGSSTSNLGLDLGFPSLLGRGVFDEFFNGQHFDRQELQRKTTQGYPVLDIYADADGNTVLEFALAGFSRDELHVEVLPEKQSITVSASPVGNKAPADGRRIAKRSFTKTYVNYSNELNFADAQAKYENGLLTIVVPKRAVAQPLSIQID
jgi:HSP20 family molecular chaperone IbpA